MKEKNMRFGTYIRTKRMKDPRGITLKDMSETLGMSLPMLSDIEQGRKKPFDSDKIDIFCEYLNLTNEDKELMFDLAAKESGTVPEDIEDIMMYSDIGDMARFALRLTNAGVADEADWKKFIRELEEKRGNSANG